MALLFLWPFLPMTGCLSGPGDRADAPPENRYVREADFQRISEYFTGREVVGNRIYLRSDSARRAGYYWMIPAGKVPGGGAINSAVVKVQIPGSPKEETFSFKIDQPVPDKAVLWIGLTGGDWPDPELRPVAWRIDLFSPSGDGIYSRESFLWSPPGSGDANG